ncbi:hypothetical protein MKX01_030730 [Papaver californicum]|nr:hypothetical protein MKX01_036400 [Papaver californicum]KAI3974246.1 hypothetical protein MKX01_030730 [Papaver californicum]
MNSSRGSHTSSSSSPRSSSEERDNNLSQQLQTLQSMIPNISSTADKRSILEATHDYIRRIHEETESIEKELLQRRRRSTTTTPICSSSSLIGERPKILSMEIDDLMMEGRFVVKISWRRGFSENGHVQRVVEDCLNITMTSILLDDNSPDCMLTTAFVKVKEGARMTEEQLRDQLMNIAARFGLML